MIGQDPEMLQMFLDESQEHLTNLEPDLLRLEEEKENPEAELVNRIFRAVHSLKGSAGFFGFESITALSHLMESLLALVRDGKLKPFTEMITALLAATDRLREMIADVDNSGEVDFSDLAKELDAYIKGERPEDEPVVKLVPDKKVDFDAKLIDKFEISLPELKNLLAHGHFLYLVRAFIHNDIKNKGLTPLIYIKNIEKLGVLISSFSDISQIGGLNDVLHNDIAFLFLFSSVLEPDLISLGLDLPEDQIIKLDPSLINETEKELPEQKTETPQKKEKKIVEKPKEVLDKPKKPSPPKTEAAENQQNESLRVQVSLLNDLMSLAGELVLARNQLLRLTTSVSRSIPGLNSVLQDIDLTTTRLQGKIMDTRMQPLSIIFNKFPRVIRDMAQQLDKEIELITIGQDVDLDKSIIEKLSDPLTHLIRNSCDHGLERSEERKAKGKNAVGKIWLKAYHESGKVNIDISDDGAGVNIQKVLTKALEKGIISKTEAERLSEKEITQLIFAPGFSTAEAVTNVSGRGVGMDVVKNNIEQLGGSVNVESIAGQGTTVNLKLPLTLAIIPSLIIKAQGQCYALPQLALKELVRIKSGDKKHIIEKVNDAPVLRLRNKLLPLVFLKTVLNLNCQENSDPLRVAVLKIDDNEFGLVVDEVFDTEEIVVKPLPRFIKHHLCYSGTTIMGDGSVALILDVGGIAQKAKLEFSEATRTTVKEVLSDENLENKQNVLLFENAEQEFFALNLDLIKRIEKVPFAQIEQVGGRKYIEHENQSLRVIELEDFLPINKPEHMNDKEVYIIIPSQMENPVGIMARSIVDSIETGIKIDTDNITSKGLMGSALINGSIVLFPDIYELAEMADPEKSERYKNTPSRKYNILLIEDTPFFRTLGTQYLTSAGYNVETAIDGLDAVKKAGLRKFDLFVVDIIMPKMDGFEFVKTVRRDERLKKIPALALTTLANEESRSKAFEAGFNEYEIKMHKEQLLIKVKQLLGQTS